MRMTAIYARVSSEQQREENTIARQTASLIEFAQSHDLEVPKEWVFEDEGLSRKYAYQILLIEEFARHGVETRFVKSPQGDSAEDQLLVQFQGMIGRERRHKRAQARFTTTIALAPIAGGNSAARFAITASSTNKNFSIRSSGPR
jgi:DNA invertase Pin-like site-specific DNA recombinase